MSAVALTGPLPTPSYNNLGDRGISLFAMGIVGLVLTTTTFGLRMWTRLRIVKAFGWDDWVIVLTQLIYVWMTIDMIIMALLGFGQHEVYVSLSEIVAGFMHALLAEIAYTACVFCIRLSVCLLYFRFTSAPWQRWVLWSVISINGLYAVGYFLLCLNQCQPISYAWNQFISTDGACLPGNIVVNASYAHNSLSIASDWTLAVFPIFLLRSTKMNKRTKWGVVVLLGLGSCASVAAIVRITVLQGLNHSLDYTYRVAPVIFWSSMETTLGLVANNISTCRPIFKKFLGDRTNRSNTPYVFQSKSIPSWSTPGGQGYILNGGSRENLSPAALSKMPSDQFLGSAPAGQFELVNTHQGSRQSRWIIQKKSETFFETDSNASDEEKRIRR